MGKLDRLRIWYDDEGLISLPKAAWMVFIYYSPAYHLIEKLFGEVIHEKMIRGPRIGYWPQIKNPRSFNEKILHRKLFTDNEKFVLISDKYRVREHVTEKVGDEFLNDVYAVTNDPSEIPFDELPEKYVIKANNGCGSNIIVQGNDKINREEVIEKCDQWLSTPHGQQQREYWYEHIDPLIIVEKYIESDYEEIPRDYKFFVFNGNVKYVEVDMDRFSGHKRRFYNTDWEPYEFRNEYPLAPIVDKPTDLAKMISTAEQLGAEFDHIRIDLYNPKPGEILFGEMTVAHESGIGKFDPVDYDFELGKHW